jgi:hypothetical protein
MAENFTDLARLKTYIQERLLIADPSLNVTDGSSLDTEFITPLIVRLGPDPYDTPIEEFVMGRLRTEFPNLVLQEGDPLFDYGVKIMRILLEPFRRQIRQVSNNQSLAYPDTLNLEEADNLGANFYVTRKVGGYSVGVARLYFSSPQYTVVTPSNAVFTSTDLQFYPVQNQAITADMMLFNVDGNLYYFDIVARANTQGEEYNIEPGFLVGVSGMPSVVKVANRAAFSEGDNAETASEFITRVDNSLTEKSLVTIKGINARVLEIFQSIKSIQVIGYGDIEMNRDIITGSTSAVTYALAQCTVSDSNLNEVVLGAWLSDGNPAHTDFSLVGIAPNDRLSLYSASTGLKTDVLVQEVTATTLKVFPALSIDPLSIEFFMVTIGRMPGEISISNIPGGILVPNTAYGEIQIKGDQIHIGGMLDVFIRAGDPQQREIVLEAIRDELPLRFGLDLESFGEDDDEFINITNMIATQANIPANDTWGIALAPRNQVIIRVEVTDHAYACVPWYPTIKDVGRYIQLGGPTHYGTFEITKVYDKELMSDHSEAVRIEVDLFNHDDGTTLTNLTSGGTYDHSFRLREKTSVKCRVRDRDDSRNHPLPGPGVDFDALGAVVGDSVVIETGSDAGTYTIRRIVESIGSGDTLILDRDLSKTLKPSGLGDKSGLRYRVTDNLDIDLVEPRVAKIPLGEIFTGTDLNTVAGVDVVTVSGGDTNFLLAGAVAGDTLEIRAGDNRGKYAVLEVRSGTTLRLGSTLISTLSQQQFYLYKAFTGVSRPMVRVKTAELLDSSKRPTGITIPYGDSVDARILGKLSNRDAGNEVESYTGETTDSVTLYDTEADFISGGVLPGWRLSILTGNNVGDYVISTVTDLHTLVEFRRQVGEQSSSSMSLTFTTE